MLSIMRCCVQADGTGTNRNAGLRRYSSNIVLLIVALGCHFAWASSSLYYQSQTPGGSHRFLW